jgi:hypothetical protein
MTNPRGLRCGIPFVHPASTVVEPRSRERLRTYSARGLVAVLTDWRRAYEDPESVALCQRDLSRGGRWGFEAVNGGAVTAPPWKWDHSARTRLRFR